MRIELFDLWDEVPGMCEETPKLTAYLPDENKTGGAVVILPGGGHGLGLAPGDTDMHKSVHQWNDLLINWLKLIKFI